MNLQLQELATAISDFKKAQNTLKQNFIKSIRDKTIPLDERWQFWCDAPSSLKDFSQFSIKFDCMGKQFHWHDELHISRREQVDLDNLVWDLEGYVDSQADEDTVFLRRLFRHPELLDELKEEILARNLEYFTYDW